MVRRKIRFWSCTVPTGPSRACSVATNAARRQDRDDPPAHRLLAWNATPPPTRDVLDGPEACRILRRACGAGEASRLFVAEGPATQDRERGRERQFVDRGVQ